MNNLKEFQFKKLALIILQVAGLYVLSTFGEFIAALLKLPIPGSIIGLLLLFAGLHFNIIPESYIKEGGGFLLVILPLFFIPATVGIVQYPEFLSIKGVMLIVIVVVSTFLTMIVAGRTSEWYERKKVRKEA